MTAVRASSSPPVPQESWSLNLNEIGHECPLSEGVLAYAKRLKSKGEWPPSVPIFEVDGNSLYRQWLRHFWLEVHADFPPFILVDGPPGFGKSLAAKRIGTDLDGGFTNGRLIYNAIAISEALSNSEPMSVYVLDDAVASRTLFGRDWARNEQKDTVTNILGHARDRKVILVILSQSGTEFDRIIREDVRPWWVQIEARSMDGSKQGVLHHSRQVYMRVSRIPGAIELGTKSVYDFGTHFQIPGMNVAAVASYQDTRHARFGQRPEKS